MITNEDIIKMKSEGYTSKQIRECQKIKRNNLITKEVLKCASNNAIRLNTKRFYRNAENQLFKIKIGCLRTDDVKVKTKVNLLYDNYDKRFYKKWLIEKREIGINIYGKNKVINDNENLHKSKDSWVYVRERGIR